MTVSAETPLIGPAQGSAAQLIAHAADGPPRSGVLKLDLADGCLIHAVTGGKVDLAGGPSQSPNLGSVLFGQLAVPPSVVSSRQEFEVVGIDARGVLARMMKIEPFRGWAIDPLPHPPMHEHRFPGGAGPCVSRLGQFLSPVPAPGFGIDDVARIGVAPSSMPEHIASRLTGDIAPSDTRLVRQGRGLAAAAQADAARICPRFRAGFLGSADVLARLAANASRIVRTSAVDAISGRLRGHCWDLHNRFRGAVPLAVTAAQGFSLSGILP